MSGPICIHPDVVDDLVHGPSNYNGRNHADGAGRWRFHNWRIFRLCDHVFRHDDSFQYFVLMPPPTLEYARAHGKTIRFLGRLDAAGTRVRTRARQDNSVS